jgi:hypothetical protein
MGGGSLILTLYVLCAIGVVVLIAIGLVLFVIGRRREAQGRDQGRAQKLERMDE